MTIPGDYRARIIICVLIISLLTTSFAQEPIYDMELLDAVYNQETALVETLLESGANANARDYENVSALMFALKGENDTIIQLLLDYSADIRHVDNSGMTVLMHGVIGGKHAFVREILPYISQVNNQDINGYTALIYAVQNDDVPMAELLITSGANIHLKTNLGTTALTHAAAFGSFYNVDYLISQLAVVNTTANDGSTPLHLAAWYGHNEIIGLLLDSGANIDEPDNEGNTPLMVAILADQAETVWYLAESGASLTKVNNDGLSILSLASSSGNKEIYRLIIQYDFEEPMISDKNKSALAYAYFNRNNVLAKEIKKNNGFRPQGLYFSEVWLQQGFDFNSTDIFYHSAAGVFESRFKLLITLNYHTRIGYRHLNVPLRENYIYRFHEKRNILSAGLYREIVLATFSGSNRIGLLPGAEVAYSFSRYKGSGINPPGGWDVIPAISLFVHTRRFTYYGGYNYLDTRQQNIELHRYRAGLIYRIPLYKTRQLKYKPVLF